MKKIGKYGQINRNSNIHLKWLYTDYGITNCELRYKDCTMNNFLGFAHRHKRDFYKSKGKQELLASFKHTILACNNCHDIIEDNKELTEEVFNNLRGKE